MTPQLTNQTDKKGADLTPYALAILCGLGLNTYISYQGNKQESTKLPEEPWAPTYGTNAFGKSGQQAICVDWISPIGPELAIPVEGRTTGPMLNEFYNWQSRNSGKLISGSNVCAAVYDIMHKHLGLYNPDVSLYYSKTEAFSQFESAQTLLAQNYFPSNLGPSVEWFYNKFLTALPDHSLATLAMVNPKGANLSIVELERIKALEKFCGESFAASAPGDPRGVHSSTDSRSFRIMLCTRVISYMGLIDLNRFTQNSKGSLKEPKVGDERGVSDLDSIGVDRSVCRHFSPCGNFFLTNLGVRNVLVRGFWPDIHNTEDGKRYGNHVLIFLPSDNVVFDPSANSFEQSWFPVSGPVHDVSGKLVGLTLQGGSRYVFNNIVNFSPFAIFESSLPKMLEKAVSLPHSAEGARYETKYQIK